MTNKDYQNNAPPEEMEMNEESSFSEDGLAGLEKMEIPQPGESGEKVLVEDIEANLNEELEELPLDDSGNPELDKVLLERTDPYFRGSLDVDEDRSQKGITSALERTEFGKREEADTFSKPFNESDMSEKELPDLEEKFFEDEIPSLDDSLEEEETEEEKPHKKASKQKILKNVQEEASPINDSDDREEDLDDIVENYYRNLGEEVEVHDTLSFDDSLLKNDGIVQELEPEFVEGDAAEYKNRIHGSGRHEKEFINQALQDDEWENVQTSSDEEREWQEFINEDIYSVVDPEEDTGVQRRNIKIPEGKQSVPTEESQAGHEERTSERKSGRKAEKEFHQVLEDDQMDYDQNIRENTLADVSAGVMFGLNNHENISVDNVKQLKGMKSGSKNEEIEKISGKPRNSIHHSTSSTGTWKPSDKTVPEKGMQNKDARAGNKNKESGDSYTHNPKSGQNQKKSGYKRESINQALEDAQRTFEEQQHKKSGEFSNSYFSGQGAGTASDRRNSFDSNSKDEYFNGRGRTFNKRNQFSEDGSTIYMSTFHTDQKIGNSIGKIVLRDIKRAGRYGRMYAAGAVRGNSVADGLIITSRSVGTFVLAPYAKHLTKQALRLQTRRLIKKMNQSPEFAFMRDPKKMGQVLKPYVMKKYEKSYQDGMESRYMQPQKVKHILEMKRWLEKDLKEKGYSTDKNALKKLLKDGKLPERDREVAQAYLKLSQISKIAEKTRFQPIKNALNMANKLKFSVKLAIRRNSNQNNNHLLTGAFIASRYARTAVKTAYRTFRSASKAAKYLIPRVKNAGKKINADTATKLFSGRRKETNGDPSRVLNNRKIPKTKKALGKAGRAMKKSATSSEERLSWDSTVSAAQKESMRASQNAVKASQKAVKAVIKSIKAIIYLVVNVINMILAMLGPIVLVAIILFVVIFSVKSLFDLEKGTYYEEVSVKTEQEKEADEEVSLQQYADILKTCRDNYREKTQKLYELEGFESVNITYRDKKNNGITKIYEEAKESSNDVVTGDNIREILAMTSVLFNINYENYVTDGEKWSWFKEAVNLNRTTKKDLEKLEDFFRANGLNPDDYKDTTYQKLIRSFLLGLYNGSHPATKRIETTYCEGCVQLDEIIDIDEEGNPIYASYCPGHKHLYVSITTYYFDDIFSCKLKKESDIVTILKEVGFDTGSDGTGSGGIDFSGSSTVEILWNGLTAKGYSDEAKAGIIGNLMWESGGGPSDIKLNAVEGGSGEGIGMCQWSGGRKTTFLSFLSSKGISWPNENANCQLEFMLYELDHGQWSFAGTGFGYSTKYNVSLETFKNCKDVATATNVFCACFERCYEWDAHMSTRISYAQGVYNTYHNKSMQ